MDPLLIFLYFVVGIGAAFIGTIAGGGGLLSIALMIFMGLPPDVAIATNKLGALGVRIGSIPTFIKKKRVLWKYVLPLSIVSIIGSIIGAQALVSVDKSLLDPIVVFALLIPLPFLFAEKKLGVERKKTSRIKKYAGGAALVLIGLWSGFFGGGQGTLEAFTLIYFFGFTMIDGAATRAIPGFFGVVVSLIIFQMNGIINFTVGIPLLLGMIIGGYLAAHYMIKNGEAWAKTVFIVVIIGSAIKLIFF